MKSKLLNLKLNKNFKFQISDFRDGFTLIELLIVITVIGVLAGIVLLAVNPGKQFARARDAQRKQNLAELSKALQGYYVFNGAYPDPGQYGAESFNGSDSTQTNFDGFWIPGLIVPSYLKLLPKDPKQANLPIFLAVRNFFQNVFDNLTKPTKVFAVTTGGTITPCGAYTCHTFTSDGTFTPDFAGTVEYLVVGGGGGGGGRHAGGGGGGGVRSATSFAVSPIAYTVAVGNGGTAAPYGGRGGNGGDSVFSTITSTGGGGGGGYSGDVATVNGNSGGSGGGGAEATGLPGGTGTYGAGNTPSTSPSQGNNGGVGLGNGGTNDWAGGGGGGAGAAGTNATASYQGGTGGVGISSSISGAATYYGGGGGGAGGNNVNLNGGAGGLGGGGRGTGAFSPTQGVAGTANTGGGGGGSRDQAGPVGGSGIVIIRYLSTPPPTPTPTSPPPTPTTPPPTPIPSPTPGPLPFKYLYTVTSDFQSFTLWAGLEDSDDPEIYNKPGAKCQQSPPSPGYNYCVSF